MAARLGRLVREERPRRGGARRLAKRAADPQSQRGELQPPLEGLHAFLTLAGLFASRGWPALHVLPEISRVLGIFEGRLSPALEGLGRVLARIDEIESDDGTVDQRARAIRQALIESGLLRGRRRGSAEAHAYEWAELVTGHSLRGKRAPVAPLDALRAMARKYKYTDAGMRTQLIRGFKRLGLEPPRSVPSL